MKTAKLNIQHAATCEAICDKAAGDWIEIVCNIITEYGLCNVALSGGRTPILFYHQLLKHSNLSRIDWSRVHLFLGDERYVPPDHAESNFRMTREQLLTRIPIPALNVHPVKTDLPLKAAVDDYANTLSEYLLSDTKRVPQFDLIMLGMGADGHTASLFPGTSAVDETEAHVVAVTPVSVPNARISITFPVINAARHVMLLVCGEDKAGVIKDIFNDNTICKYPVQHVKPKTGRLHWYLDAAAAGVG